MITLADYQVSNPGAMFGTGTSEQELGELNKALSAGDTTGQGTLNLTTASGAPLKVESLEKTLKVLTHTKDEVTLWKNVPKSAAYNTVEEYNQLSSYGADRGGFNGEGELPQEEDSTYIRRAQLVKFLGVTKSVTHPMSLVNTQIGNIVEKEIQNGTLWILRKLDKGLYDADEKLIPEEFNGFLTQHRKNDQFATINDYFNSGLVIDMRGSILTEIAIESAANTIAESFGRGTELYAPPKVISNFVKNFYGNKFIGVGQSGAIQNATVGQSVKNFESQFGNIGLNWDVFFNKKPTKLYNAAATHTSAPNAPTVGGAPAAAVGASAYSVFAAGDAGNYIYGVIGNNKYGDSAMTILDVTPTTVVAGGAVDLQFTGTASTYPATAFTIYRSQKGATTPATSTMYPLFTISLAELTAGYDLAAAGKVRDNNRWMSDTDKAFLVQFDTDVIEFKQLAPLMKMDLAVTSPAYRFMMLLYGTPFLYNIRRLILFVNIGSTIPA